MTILEHDAKASPEMWEPMALTYVGHVGEVLQVGGGNLVLCAVTRESPASRRGKSLPSATRKE